MSFNIPNYKDLVLEQLDIINLPTNQDWVIQGGPGTGKTVMAIFRAQQVAKYRKTVILVYNRPLKLFLEEAVKDTKCEVKTYHEWLADVYHDCFNRRGFPHVADYEPDYARIERDLQNVGVRFDHTIIDEAQDCPIELVRIVKRLSKNITCFVDPNQEILKNKTNSTQLIKTICVEAPFLLTRNFRNTKQVRDASAVFCQDGTPARAFTHGNTPTLVKCKDYDEQTEYICQFCLNNRESTIGVIVDPGPDGFKLWKIYNELYPRLSPFMPVQMYKTLTDMSVDFSQTGVQMFSYGTMKGLEFDHVIIPRIDAVYASDDTKKNFNQLYVATSRPRKELKIVYFRERCNSKWIDAFSKIIPKKELFNWEVF